MRDRLRDIFRRIDPSAGVLYGFGSIVLISLFAALIADIPLLVLIPAAVLVIFVALVDFRSLFFLLLFCIPLSTEFTFPNGFGTDLPTEPLMIGLMLVFGLFLFRHGPELSPAFFRHPITLLLLLHVGWILVTAITSGAPFISFKFFMAKIWYVVTFFFLAGHLLRDAGDIRKMFWIIFIPTVFTVGVALARHAYFGFSFEYVHKVFAPFYRNHVSYAALISTFFPFVWFMRRGLPSRSAKRKLLGVTIIVLLIAIQLSYTRAAYVAIFIALGAYFVIRLRLTRLAILTSLACATALVLFLSFQNRFLDFAPNYEQTVSHYDFNSLIEATYQMKDISTMERVYRWVAGFYMAREKPLTGFGPGNFYNNYQSYTVGSFKTYVSGNPEKSGIHSYYLMTLVEQGLPGLLFFLVLVFGVLIRGERLYHQVQDPFLKDIVMMCLLSFVIILCLLIINDLVETDKIGSFFFLILAILVNIDISSAKALSPNGERLNRHG